jgi:hypothetical protein
MLSRLLLDSKPRLPVRLGSCELRLASLQLPFALGLSLLKQKLAPDICKPGYLEQSGVVLLSGIACGGEARAKLLLLQHSCRVICRLGQVLCFGGAWRVRSARCGCAGSRAADNRRSSWR